MTSGCCNCCVSAQLIIRDFVAVASMVGDVETTAQVRMRGTPGGRLTVGQASIAGCISGAGQQSVCMDSTQPTQAADQQCLPVLSTACALHLQFPSPFEQPAVAAGDDAAFSPPVRKAVPPSGVTFGVAIARPTNTLIGQAFSTNGTSAPVAAMDNTTALHAGGHKAYPGSSNPLHIDQDKPYAGGAAPQDHRSDSGRPNDTEVVPPQQPPATQLGSVQQQPQAALDDTVPLQNGATAAAGPQQLPVFRPAAPPVTGTDSRPAGGSRPSVSKESARQAVRGAVDSQARQRAGRRSLHALA